ncbi:unnamed protein product [Medioppia subpectinata]|uniref:Uncharacterized protein n=1 Tax=Medioppia subpectinata TaxID=1979941 RepID=A0A7R9Q4B6_9ACAR|nr:unnamed protein product [Medioppia subpectinata]CAG2112130.1 unnamed protein product [Medioppia subpectinata]
MDQKTGQPMEPPPPYSAQPGMPGHAMPPPAGFMPGGQPATIYPAQPGISHLPPPPPLPLT